MIAAAGLLIRQGRRVFPTVKPVSRTAGAHTAGARTAGARTAGARTAGARTAGAKTRLSGRATSRVVAEKP